MAKENRINLRFDDDEFALLLKKSGGKPLATFCYEVVLGSNKRVRKKQTKYSNYPPEITRNLSAIGNNLNQIARLGHSARKDNNLELLQLLDAIEVIRSDISDMVSSSACKNV